MTLYQNQYRILKFENHAPLLRNTLILIINLIQTRRLQTLRQMVSFSCTLYLSYT